MNKENNLEKEKVSLYSEAEKLKENYSDGEELILAIGNYVSNLPERYNPKSIIESRFTPAEEAFEKGMMSCGAIVNMSTAMLRHVGFEVKLIHGECKKSVDHAWVSVFDSENEKWVDYDFTQKDPTDLSGHVEKERVDSWDEIKDKILKDHETLRERRLARGENFGE